MFETFRDGLDNIKLVIDALLSLPPTSVNNETTFSRTKLSKGKRRGHLKTDTLKDLIQVEIETANVEQFDPKLDGNCSFKIIFLSAWQKKLDNISSKLNLFLFTYFQYLLSSVHCIIVCLLKHILNVLCIFSHAVKLFQDKVLISLSFLFDYILVWIIVNLIKISDKHCLFFLNNLYCFRLPLQTEEGELAIPDHHG